MAPRIKKNWRHFHTFVKHLPKEEWADWGFEAVANNPAYLSRVNSEWKVQQRVDAHLGLDPKTGKPLK